MGETLGLTDLTARFVEARLEAALDADEAGDILHALSETERALAADPREPRAHALAAVYSALLERERAALRHARKALAVTPTTAEICYWCGVARHIIGAQESALEALDLALALEPKHEAAGYLRARCLAHLDAPLR